MADGTAPTVLIRPATAADFEALLQLGREMWAESDYRDEPFDDDLVRQQLPALAAKAMTYFAVAEGPGRQLVGFILATAARRFFNHSIYADEFLTFVQPQWRGRGVFQQLIAAWETWARDRRMRHTFFGCFTDWGEPEKMTALMTQMGYARIGVAYRKAL